MRTYLNVIPIGSRSGPSLKQSRSGWLLAPSVAGMFLTQFSTVLAFMVGAEYLALGLPSWILFFTRVVFTRALTHV